MSDFKTIEVKPVKNTTLQYGIESVVETAIKSAFVNDGRLSLVNDKSDISVSTTVNAFKKEPYDYDVGGNVKSYKVSLTAEILIVGKGLEKPIYKGEISDWVIESSTDFDLEKAKEDVAKKIANDIIERIFSYW